MTRAITLSDWIGPHGSHPDCTMDVREAAAAMLDRVNVLLAVAYSDGLLLDANPRTGSLVSGTRYGGFRPGSAPIGAAKSKHKTGHAVDVYDPRRTLATWCAANLEQVAQIGLWCEDWRWTPSWCHFQDVPPGSGLRVYIPSTSPALASAVPGQVVA